MKNTLPNKSFILITILIFISCIGCQKKARKSSINEVSTDLINIPEATPSPQDQELQDLINQSKASSAKWQEINQDKRRKAHEDSLKANYQKNINPTINTNASTSNYTQSSDKITEKKKPNTSKKKRYTHKSFNRKPSQKVSDQPIKSEEDFSTFQVNRGQTNPSNEPAPSGSFLARFAENTILTENSKYVYVQMLEPLRTGNHSYWTENEIIQFNIIKNTNRLILKAILPDHRIHLSVFHPVDLKEGLKVLEGTGEEEQDELVKGASEIDITTDRLFGGTGLAQPISTIDFIIRKSRSNKNDSFQLPVSLYYKFYVKIISSNQ